MRASQKTSAPAWFHLIIPSVADLIFVVLLFSLAYGSLAQRLLSDADIGWHIRSGQQIVRAHAAPLSDSFSSTMGGKPWFAWEWLYDLAIGIIYSSVGLNGVVFLSALIITLTFSYLFRLLLVRGASLPIAVVFVLLSASASTIHLLARPHLVSWLLAVIWLQILDSCEADSIARGRIRSMVFWLPALMLLWVNLHGGFLMGLVLLGIYLLAAGIRFFSQGDGAPRELTGKWAKTLGAVTGLCALASFANPYGYKLHVHVYQYLSNRFLMDHIDEFLSPNFHGLPQKCFALLLLLSMLTLAINRRPPRSSHLLVVLFAAYAGLYASRNIPIASILLALVIAPLLSQVIAELAGRNEISSRLRQCLSRLQSFSGALLLGCWVCLHHGRLGSRQLMDAQFDAKRFPVQAAEVLVQQQVHEPVFSPDLWGGYLIYRLYPHLKVVVDDRHDLYGEEFLKDYLKTVRVEPGWDKLLKENHVNWILIPVGSSLSSILKGKPAWKIVHEDEVAILFYRAGER